MVISLSRCRQERISIEFYLSSTRNAQAAKRFLGKALPGLKEWVKPQSINTDKAPTYTAAIKELKDEGICLLELAHRQAKYLNNIIEADHDKLKQLIKPTLSFKSMKTTYTTTKGFELIRMLKKWQMHLW